MDLHNPNIFIDEDDGPLALHESHPKTGILCAETIRKLAASTEEPAYFEVCDLAADARFSQLNIVEELKLAYYCGVPIRTSNKIVIGTVLVLDDKVREPISVQHLLFLTSIADNVMMHLENRKQRMDVTRIMKMNKSLASFMDSHQDDRKPPAPDRSGNKSQDTPVSSEQNSRRDSTDKSSKDELPPGNGGRDYNQVFSRASALLRQSLSLSEKGGGVIFLDTKSSGRSSTGQNLYRRESGPKRDSSRLAADTARLSRTPSDEDGNRQDSLGVHAAILACSVCVAPSGDPDQTCHSDEDPPAKIPVKILLKFIKKVPGGQVYHFPELRYPRTGELVRARSGNSQHHGSIEEADVRSLFSHLPGAVEIIFVPLWNTHLGRWSVCLAYTLSSERNFTLEIDYFFCRAFCNCVKAEVDRCAVVLADQQKGDFIGSVSHELRSPLHGILASCELIQETEMSRFQALLIDTTESCAHTLLDTIQMVLDYSKVNAFTKHPPGERLNVRPHVVKGGVEPLLSTYSHVNLAAIAEEVIEGVTTGFLAKSDPSLELGYPGERAKRDAKTFEDLIAMPQSPVEVILDVSPPQDWTFITQPGAYRRIIMNIFGNSLKYTEHGYIKISLNCEEMNTKESDPSMAMVELAVEDSGKGISQAYMDTKMFTPFAQENALAPGLSLVRSLVQMMDGEIEVQSEVNHGTQVKVKIPMKRASSRDPRDGFHRPNEDDIQTLRTILPRPQIVNFQQDMLPEDTPQKQEGYQMQKHALAACINGWYKVADLHHWDIDMDTKPDIILVDDVHLLAITKHLKLLKEIDAVVVILCSDRSRTTVISRNVDYPKLHIMPKPFGPFKLAKALKHALDRRGPARGTPHGSAISKEIGPIPELKQSSATPRQIPSHSENLSKLIKKPSFNGSFPFPSMTVTPPSVSPTPSIPGITPQIEVSGTYQRRLKALDVPTSKQKPLEKHNKLIRSRSEGQAGSVQLRRVKPRILLVDNNEVNLKLLQTFFVRRGFTDMKLARDGSEAVRVYEDALHQHNPFNLVFMDISMPVMDGFEATSHIRQREISMGYSDEPYHSLVVALTGNASAEDQTQAFTNGMDMYMTKPVSLKEVGELMKAWEEKSAIYGAEGARSALLECNAAE
ncbi:hypothetical protein E4T52_02210 [Aureobasidium sp. EXF-3400]|nr:hypothetical protein E4T52_02210 [Aureobasidium sp. EXF-3400]